AIGLCWIPVVFIQLRVARRSAELAASRQQPDLSYRRLMRFWYALGWPAFLATIGIFFLIIFKPS
ncbi:DUF2269 family protein, partial [Klebsiella pneumoniae]|uniref:DUF2269 family protein n=1 Tax=Klebsiella pneumoniae TaxID=573 RepID=UPI00272FC26D